MTETGTELLFPIAQGVVVEVLVRDGDKVAFGERMLRLRSSNLLPVLSHTLRGRGLPPHIQSGRRGDHWVTATRAGTVCSLRVAPGVRVSPSEGMPLLAIGDPSKVVVVGEYHASHVAGFRPGQKAVVRLQDTDKELEGDLLSIGNVVDRVRQTVEVRVLVDNSRGLLKPNDPVELALRPTTTSRTAVLIPSTAVMRQGATASVFVEGAKGILDRREVQLGQQSEELAEILDGLEPGERVVILEST
jgi:membrane fusion protein, heavy metal efflux system